MRPEFVVIGHVVRDLVADGWRPGGTATYAAVQAQRLGLEVGIVTSAGLDVDLAKELPGVRLSVRRADVTTTFENVYEGGQRRQRVPAQAEPLEPDDVPLEWREARIVLVGPVCAEVAPGVGEIFTNGLVGVAAQGWLRRLADDWRVQHQAWTGSPFWLAGRVLFVSEEDLGGSGVEFERWRAEVPIVVLTDARRGARIYAEGRCRRIAGVPAHEVDPTGAGDVFAAAFLVRYSETEDVTEAARFASSAASASVEGTGSASVADREGIEARMARFPEITLQ